MKPEYHLPSATGTDIVATIERKRLIVRIHRNKDRRLGTNSCDCKRCR